MSEKVDYIAVKRANHQCFGNLNELRIRDLEGPAMSKFEWMELETLSTEINHAQSRLDAARATKNLGLVQLLESEIGETVKKRAEVIAQITKGLGRFAGPKPKLVAAPVHQPEHAQGERQEFAEEAQSQAV